MSIKKQIVQLSHRSERTRVFPTSKAALYPKLPVIKKQIVVMQIHIPEYVLQTIEMVRNFSSWLGSAEPTN
jgi:hypothetical protein